MMKQKRYFLKLKIFAPIRAIKKLRYNPWRKLLTEDQQKPKQNFKYADSEKKWSESDAMNWIAKVNRTAYDWL